jgi:ABC-type lipoprotein release transport system permease subunit
MRLYFRLAWRNLWRHRRRTLIVVFAMGFGLAMMMMYDGLMAGFNQAIYGNAIKVLGGNIQVHAEGYRMKSGQTPLLPLTDDAAVVKAALADNLVEAATRRINTGGLLTSPEGAFGVSLIGIEPEAEAGVNLAAQHIIAGRYLTSQDLDSLLIGKGLAEAMGVQVGDRITMVGQDVHNQMRQRTMTVVGIYDLGMADLEKLSAYISLGEAQDLFGLSGQATEGAIVLKELGKDPRVIAGMQPQLPGNEITSWMPTTPSCLRLSRPRAR